MTKLSLYLATMLLGTNFSASTLPTDTTPAIEYVEYVSTTSVEQKLVDLTNAERWDNDLRPLSVNPMLVEVAREHSREMSAKGYFDHISPTPGLRTPMNRYISYLGHTPTWAYLGENLFYCTVVDADRGHDCLMNSKKHKDNILNDRFEEIGVGVYEAPDGQFYVTQLFLAQID